MIAIRSQRFPNCLGTVNGTAIASRDSIIGTYSATNTCFPSVSGGKFSLSRHEAPLCREPLKGD